MKKALALVAVLVTAFSLSACGGSGDDAPVPIAVGDDSNDAPYVPEGGTEINEFVFYYESYKPQSDPGDGLSPADGATWAWENVLEPAGLTDELLPNEIIYISFDAIQAVDQAGGAESYVYSVTISSVQGGFLGEGYRSVMTVWVDYQQKTGGIIDDLREDGE